MSMKYMSRAVQWINVLKRHPRKLLAVFVQDYEELRKLAPVGYVRVFKNSNQEPRAFQINRDQAIAALKSRYDLKTKTEATQEIHQVMEEEGPSIIK